MVETAQAPLKPAAEVARTAPIQQASNGIRYGSYGETQLPPGDLAEIVEAIPEPIAAALHRRAYYFVPLILAGSGEDDSDENMLKQSDPDTVLITPEFSSDLSDNAVCHRNAIVAGVECMFISTRLMQDRFALAFELYINAGHHFVQAAGVPESFMNLVWAQVEAEVRGETSQDAWEHRAKALGQSASEQAGVEPVSGWTRAPQTKVRKIRSNNAIQGSPAQNRPVRRNPVDEKARTQYYEASFADAIAIYLLSLTVDFDYTELREREYPLLAAPALAERLRHVAQLFPPNAGQEFSIHYRRRSG